MIGVVLSGGQSTRMGTDKGLLKKDDLTWTEIAVEKLSSLELPIVVSVNQNQVGSYSKIFPADKLVIDNEAIPVKGPLLGLLSVHKTSPSENVLVLACDMIGMAPILLRNLLFNFTQTSYEAYVYTAGDKLQPLCGIYTSKGLQKIFDLLHQKQLKKFSMMHILECIDTKCIEVEKSFLQAFNNYNSAADLEINS
jgi:molybdopterin-guanine dinucleotide biosynthesis protein A